MREAISSNHIGTDAQAMDAMSWLEDNAPEEYKKIIAKFPEVLTATFGQHSTWFDTEAMGVDVEWGSWLVDAIEDTGKVWWQDGEPWVGDYDDEEEEEG